MQNRRGFTLIEVIIAVVVIGVGLLALVAGSAVLIAQANDLRARNAAVSAASNRLQVLGAGPCAAVSGSEAGARQLREYWQVTLRDNATRELVDSVSFFAGGRQRSVTLQTRLPC